jgi:hypothetical protein
MTNVLTLPFDTEHFKNIEAVDFEFSYVPFVGGTYKVFLNGKTVDGGWFKLGDKEITITEVESKEWVEDSFLKSFLLAKLGATEKPEEPPVEVMP